MKNLAPTCAIIGSGPSGCYTAQFLRKTWPAAEITIFEALPVPYGLLRYGVAGDHQGTKAIAVQFDRLFERGDIRFAGNITIGQDLSLADLRNNFDIVVQATGLPSDKKLNLKLSETCPVIGAGAVLKALNGHPAHGLHKNMDGSFRALGERLTIIGNGNVAMDVIRLLAKPLTEFDTTDVDEICLNALRAKGIKRINVIGRSPLSEAKFDLSMLKEILSLSSVHCTFEGIQPKDNSKAATLIQAYRHSLATYSDDGKIEVVFYFASCPEAVIHRGDEHYLEISNTPSQRDSIVFDTLITAIGFEEGTLIDPRVTEEEDAFYKVGWLSKNGKGTIASTRKDAKALVGNIARSITNNELDLSKPGYAGIADSLSSKVIDFYGWKKIDQHELTTAPANRCRQKLTDVMSMIAIARQ